jgi:hypothetical protein
MEDSREEASPPTPDEGAACEDGAGTLSARQPMTDPIRYCV